MYLVDTHAHLYLKQFEQDRAAVMQRAMDKGIKEFYLPNIDSTTIEDLLQLEEDFPEACFAMMGLHPCSVKENFQAELTIVKEWLEKRPFCAVGEIGIDLHWDTTFFEQQKEAFRQQIHWAIELDVPIVIHSRKSTWEVIEILKEESHPKLRGIFHCFGGSVEEAEAIIDLGFYLGIGGVVTFKKAGLDKTLEKVDLKHLVLETDAPYLAPVPYRGKRNESAYIQYIAERISAIKGVALEQVAAITSQNAKNIFVKAQKKSHLFGEVR